MSCSQLLRRIADLEEDWKRLSEEIPNPVYDAMTYEELTRLRDLFQEQINQGHREGSQDMPEALAIWKAASARLEKIFQGKQTWPHWRALWAGGVEETKSKTAGGSSRAVKRARK